jgi:ATP-dependent Lon protease
VREFPHAENIIDIVLRDLAGAQHIRLKPTIIVGAPGCGKSRLIRRLAEACGVHCGRFDGAGSDDASFAGTPRRWSTREPCFPLLIIALCGHANPFVMIDEIDKAGHTRNGTLQHALLPFLEPETAKRYPDPCVQSPIDLSVVSFLMTANDTTRLPAPLKDRCRILRMPALRVEHVPAILPAILADLAAERGIDARWIAPFATDEIEMVKRLLGDGSIRRLRMIVEKVIDGREEMMLRN